MRRGTPHALHVYSDIYSSTSRCMLYCAMRSILRRSGLAGLLLGLLMSSVAAGLSLRLLLLRQWPSESVKIDGDKRDASLKLSPGCMGVATVSARLGASLVLAIDEDSDNAVDTPRNIDIQRRTGRRTE